MNGATNIPGSRQVSSGCFNPWRSSSACPNRWPCDNWYKLSTVEMSFCQTTNNVKQNNETNHGNQLLDSFSLWRHSFLSWPRPSLWMYVTDILPRLIYRDVTVAASVCLSLCHHTVALSTKDMHESERQTFRAQTVNNCCWMDCIAELHIYSPKNMNDCNLHMRACLSYADTLRP